MAESAQILSVSHRHEAIADWMLAHPALPLSECAKAHGVTQPWLSIVIHSDVFREYWDRRRMEHETVLREKITGAQLAVALKAYEKLDGILDKDDVDARLVLDVAERTVARLGFEPRQRTKVIEEWESSGMRPVNSAVLAEAREKMTRRIVRETELPPGTDLVPAR